MIFLIVYAFVGQILNVLQLHDIFYLHLEGNDRVVNIWIISSKFFSVSNYLINIMLMFLHTYLPVQLYSLNLNNTNVID
jgi:hypothetical protein